ncbi:GTP 3',8-cyclase MoaA [Muricomes intestini]|uniref:GTP 3',8-cyclase MoaA n=1 Tax=Muricomes intestini TaxID=1796634 RepID=UPI002FDCF54A
MKDQYNRKIEYLRVSVTDRCNLRCVYCMPKDGIKQVAHNQILTYDEIIRICRICAGEGISKIKLTGGEPLVRKNLSELLRRLKGLEGVEQVTLTTNGVLLTEQIEDLAAAGLDAVNISLDTLDSSQYKAITRRDELDKALFGLKTVLKYPNISVKVNCVILPGINETQWIPLAGLAAEKHVDVRFIEMMPIGLGKSYPGSSQQEVLEKLEEAYGKPEALSGRFGNGPAVYVGFPEFCGKVGFISAVSHQFCGECNRVRLTAEGFLKPCLQYSTGEDLRKLLRDGAADKELKDVIKKVIFEKPRCHRFSAAENAEENTEDNLELKQMSSIGG